MKARTIVVCTLLAYEPLGPGGLDAQPLRSQLTGRITDGSGLPVAGAEVRLRGPALFGGLVETRSESQGDYRLTGLPSGTYELRVTAPGFEPVSRTDVSLPAGTTFVIDVRMAVAALTDRVDVAAAAPVIDVRTSSASATFDRHLLETLPTGRTLRSVINLAPGVTSDVAFGGAAETSNVFAVDGVRLMEPYLGAQTVRVGYTWADQVQVRALGAPAEVGQFTGAVANAILRSGSNQYRGLAEFVTAIPDWTGDNTRGLEGDLRQIPPRDTVSSWELTAQVGGPIARDRLWFFTGLTATRDEYRPFGYSGPDSTDERAPRWIVKLDAAPAARIRLQGFYEGDRGTTTAYGLDAFTTIEATGDERRRNHAWSAGLTWTPDAQTVVEVRNGGITGHSGLDPHAPASHSGPPPRFDLETGISSDNIWSWYVSGSTAITTTVSVERFAQRWGEHQLKGGVENERTAAREEEGFPGGLWFFDLAGLPVQVQAWGGSSERTTTWRTSLFAQDRWTVGRFTFEPGVRFEMNRGSVPGQPVVFTTSPVGWRLGAAWDVTSSHRTVVRVHHGRYFDPVFNYLYGFNDVTGRHPLVSYDIMPSGEWVETDPGSTESFRDATLLPGVKQPHVDQFTSGIDRQAMRDLAVEFRYVHRAFRNFIGYVDPLLAEAIPVSVLDPGSDGVLGTADDAGPITVYRLAPGAHPLELGNIPNAWRDYDALQLIATRRLAGRWQAQASYTWSRSTGTLPNLPNSNTGWWGASPSGVGTNPNFNSSRPGDIKPVFDFSEVKALGVYEPPWLGGFTVSGVYRWRNGQRWERLFNRAPFGFVRAEPLGSRRAPSFGTLDLRVEKQVPLSHGQRAGIYVEAFNVTNVGKATRFRMLSSSFFGQPAAWTDPRTVRLGARVTF